MSEFEKESLSALLDGEADELELRRLLQKSETDPALLDTWARYNLVHSVLTAEAVPATEDFAKNVARELDSEPAIDAIGSKASAATVSAVDWRQNLTKLAIAASVALVFIVGLQNANQPGAPEVADNDQVLFSGGQPPAAESVVILASEVQAELDPAAQQLVSDYFDRTMSFKEDEPVRIEHIQESPLYRLVNNLQAKP